MALLESIHVPLGTKMPDFNLKNPKGKLFTGKEQFGEKGLLIVFTCNHCPYALAVWPRFIRLAKYAKGLKVNSVAINPNINPDFPEDAPDKMKDKVKEWGIDFPYLVDETQETAKTFKAQCTPDVYLFNNKQELIYHGRFDNHWQDEKKVTREELKEAIDAYTAGKPISKDQKPSMGCSIKWRNE